MGVELDWYSFALRAKGQSTFSLELMLERKAFLRRKWSDPGPGKNGSQMILIIFNSFNYPHNIVYLKRGNVLFMPY